MNRFFVLFLVVVAVLTAVSCRETQTPDSASTVDREGHPVTLPKRIDRIISIGPANTEILIALGFADKIIAADTYSRGLEGLASGIPLFDMMAPDAEQLILMEPDAIFVTGMSKVNGIDPFLAVSNIGICILHIPSSSSIADIKADIRFIATVMGAAEQGDEIVAGMELVIDAISKIGDTIIDRKTVYFEIASVPNLYSFGEGVFLNEMLEIIGAENILADRKQWVTIGEETILDRNPDVILTNADYAGRKLVAEIMSRPGWNVLTAVQNRDVHYIDTTTSSRSSHNVVKALQEMAKAVYPDRY